MDVEHSRLSGCETSRPYHDPWFDDALRRLDTGMYLAWDPRAVLVGWAGYNLDGSYRAPQFEGRFVVRHRDIFGEDYIVKILERDEQYCPPADWVLHDLWEHHLEKWEGSIFRYHREMIEEPNAEYDRQLEAASDELLADVGRQVGEALTAKQYQHTGDFVKSKPTRIDDYF